MSELGAFTGLSPSTLHRHVASLLDTGYLRREEGSKLVELGGRALALGAVGHSEDSVYGRIRAGVSRLRTTLDETSFASQLAGEDIICIAMERGSKPLHLSVSIGQTIPPRRAASARVVLASLPVDQATAIYERAGDGKPCSGLAEFLDHLAQIREQGHDTCDDELDVGVWAVAVPILHSGDYRNGVRLAGGTGVVGALAVAGPSKRFRSIEERQEAVILAKRTARGVSNPPEVLEALQTPGGSATLGANHDSVIRGAKG